MLDQRRGAGGGARAAAASRATWRAAASTEVQVLIDGTNSNTASLVSSYAGSMIAEYSADVMERQQSIEGAGAQSAARR